MKWKSSLILCYLLLVQGNILGVDAGAEGRGPPAFTVDFAGRHISGGGGGSHYFHSNPGGYYYQKGQTRKDKVKGSGGGGGGGGGGAAATEETEMECDGEANFMSDIGVVSFILSVFSSSAGIIALTKLTGTPAVIVSVMDETAGLLALGLDSLTTFPDKYDKVKVTLKGIIGRDVVDDFLVGYGCGEEAAAKRRLALRRSRRRLG